MICSNKNNLTLIQQVSQESLSRTPSPFKKVEDKLDRKSIKERL
jgi:hypothetical protein